jgi:group I intron endonuclease
MTTGIYLIVSPTGKYYVGQSIDIEKRWSRYRRLQCKSQPRIYNSLLKHGHESHSFSVLEKCSREELNTFERQWYDFFSLFQKDMMNLTLPEGDGMRAEMPDEVKKKIAKANKGNKSRTGQVQSEQEKENRRNTLDLLEYKHSDATRLKMCKPHRKGYRQSAEHIQKRVESFKTTRLNKQNS